LEGNGSSYESSDESQSSGSNTHESSSFSASHNAVENQNGGNVLRTNAYSREKETRDEQKTRNDAERSSSWLHFNEQPKNTRYEGNKTSRPDTVRKDLVSSIKTSSLKFENLQRESESRSKEVANEPHNVESDGENPPPLAGTNVMNIILVAAECAPWSKTGN
jgi:starch synthase